MNADNNELARLLDRLGWALFFIWVGVALLADLGWAWSLLGVATIILAGEGIRRLKSLPVQVFSVAVGALCLLIAAWELLAISRPMVPMLAIGFGLVLLVGAFRRPRANYPESGRSGTAAR